MSPFEHENALDALGKNNLEHVQKSVEDASLEELNKLAQEVEMRNQNIDVSDDIDISAEEREILETRTNEITRENLDGLHSQVELQRLLGNQEQDTDLYQTLSTVDKKIDGVMSQFQKLPLIGGMFDFSLRDFFWDKWFGILGSLGMENQKEKYQTYRTIRDVIVGDTGAGKSISFAGIDMQEWKTMNARLKVLQNKGITLEALTETYIRSAFNKNLEATKEASGTVDVSDALRTTIDVSLTDLVHFGEANARDTDQPREKEEKQSA